MDNRTVGQQKLACVILRQIDVVLHRHASLALADGKDPHVQVHVGFDSDLNSLLIEVVGRRCNGMEMFS